VKWAWLAGVLLATLLVHAAAREGDFVFFDDGRFVTRNPSIDTVGNPLRFFTDLETTAEPDSPSRDIYRPVRTLSFALITGKWGKRDAGAFHAFAIVLHALSAVVLALVLRAAGIAAGPAAIGALFWALHPMTVEVTAWVCSLGDAWCGLFSLLAVLAWAKKRPVPAYAAFVLALFSKEHAVVIPGLWLAWDFFLRRDELKAGALKGAAPGLLVAIVFLVYRGSLGVETSQLDAPVGLGTVLSGLGWYAATVLFPFTPTFQARVEPSGVGVLFGLLTLAALGLGIWKGDRRTRLACAWFLIALVPVSNVFVPLRIPTADRFLYLPLMGLAFLPARACVRWPREATVGAVIVLLLGASLTLVRIGDWRDSDALVKAGLRVEPKSHMLVWQLAASTAQAAQRSMDARDFATAERLVNAAVQEYRRYFVNAGTRETARVWMEFGTLLYNWGTWMQRVDKRAEYVRSWSAALTAFLTAHELHKAGEPASERDKREAARRAAELAARLAEPENPELTRTIKKGLDSLTYLEGQFGEDVKWRRAGLIFVHARSLRAKEPQKSRAGLDFVLEVCDDQEPKGVYVKYLRAQALLTRGVIKPYAREDVIKAYDLFVEVAGERRELALEATFRAAQACCTRAKLFGEEDQREKGLVILRSIQPLSEKIRVRVALQLKKHATSLAQTCGR
jgi:hypothetical protein